MAIELMGTREEEAPLVIDISERETPKNRTSDIHILSCAFLVFLAYGAAQNLGTTVNAYWGQRMLCSGNYWLLVVYSCKFEAYMTEHFSSYFGWYTMIPVSFFLGLAASIIWVGEGHILLIAHIRARDANLHEGTVIGQFNGEFWAMFARHQVTIDLYCDN
ncbi:Major facilitator superfamily protein isoform 2 [Gossypium australe]|uniref:Major facilitator superfamily protein isoform 2 n=1 Tax=Gossypium australe TaxID=47621 RepID=A0A5B6V3X2_9ROSI|nr:Major facilitator superfamily protein isoform 2 [Gossypium australe]